jgi:hypothetical protein
MKKIFARICTRVTPPLVFVKKTAASRGLSGIARNKFGVTYSVYDGLELLESSLRSIRPACDYINIVYSDESWYGEKSPIEIRPILQDLVARGLADEILEYKVDTKQTPIANESKKRNAGMRAALRAGCDYLMSMDADEYYVASELESMKSEMLEKGITHSYACSLPYRNATEMIALCNGMHSQYVQTFCKINRFSKFGGSRRKLVTVVDPTRRISNRWQRQKHWVFNTLWMHHYIAYRKDFTSKCRNSSSSGVRATNAANSRAMLDRMPAVEMDNIFGLPIF